MNVLELHLHNDKNPPYMVRLMFGGKISQFFFIDRALMFTLVLK